jgi:hypothetical protein
VSLINGALVDVVRGAYREKAARVLPHNDGVGLAFDVIRQPLNATVRRPMDLDSKLNEATKAILSRLSPGGEAYVREHARRAFLGDAQDGDPIGDDSPAYDIPPGGPDDTVQGHADAAFSHLASIDDPDDELGREGRLREAKKHIDRALELSRLEAHASLGGRILFVR